MSSDLTRRQVIKAGVGAMALAAGCTSRVRVSAPKTVRLGVVGVGYRGRDHIRTALSLGGVEINAVADINVVNLAQAQRIVEQSQGKCPKGYSAGPEDYRNLVLQPDLDAVITAAPWGLHAPASVSAMKAGKYAATEVPAALTLEECWELIDTSEATGMPCMMLENVCYFRDMLLILNIVRKGLLGELIHCEAGYQHDIREAGTGFKFDEEGRLTWRGRHAARRDGNLYPTHPIGPIAQYLNINRGDQFSYLVSMSSKSLGLNNWIRKKHGPDHENSRRQFALGDINTTLIKTHKGCTIVLYHDTQLPRPYDLIFRVQGVEGIYMKTLDSIYIEDVSPRGHRWETIENYRSRYEHPLWKALEKAATSHGHGGADYITLHQFVKAVRERTQTPQDVYDAASWSAISALSEASVAQRSAAIDFPDFTRGKWQTRPPIGIESA